MNEQFAIMVENKSTPTKLYNSLIEAQVEAKRLCIKERSKVLAEQVLALWPLPKLSTTTLAAQDIPGGPVEAGEQVDGD